MPQGSLPDTTRIEAAYDAVAEAYAEKLGDELAQKPFDRALLDVFAELVGGDFLGQQVGLEFRLLPLEGVRDALRAAGFTIDATLERRGHAGVEYPSQRAYVLARREGGAA